MKSILEELYYGNIRPFEERKKKNIDNHLSYMEEFHTEFIDTLTERQKECFNSYETHMSEIVSSTECEAFVFGFRLAMKILFEST